MLDFEVPVASEDTLEFACLYASVLEQAPEFDATAFSVYHHILVSCCPFADVLGSEEAAPCSLLVPVPSLALCFLHIFCLIHLNHQIGMDFEFHNHHHPLLQ